jgi:hypothetical protein
MLLALREIIYRCDRDLPRLSNGYGRLNISLLNENICAKIIMKVNVGTYPKISLLG